MDLIRNPMFWKFVSFVVISCVVLWIPFVDTDYVRGVGWFADEDELEALEVTSGIRAAFSALAAAATLLVNLIPARPDERMAGQINFLGHFLGAAAAALAGWYWLSAETGDNPTPYIIPMVILGVVVGAIMIFRALWEFASDVFNREDMDTDEQGIGE